MRIKCIQFLMRANDVISCTTRRSDNFRSEMFVHTNYFSYLSNLITRKGSYRTFDEFIYEITLAFLQQIYSPFILPDSQHQGYVRFLQRTSPSQCSLIRQQFGNNFETRLSVVVADSVLSAISL